MKHNKRAKPIQQLADEINYDRRHPKSKRQIFREEIQAQHKDKPSFIITLDDDS